MTYSTRFPRARSSKRSVVVTCVLFALVIALGAFQWLRNRNAPAPTTATLSVISGEATVTRADAGADPPLREGETTSLQSGDEVKTGAGSGARLTFSGGATVELGSETRLGVLDLCQTSMTRAVATILALHQGETLTRIPGSLLQGARFEIETNVATVQARGTEFQCDALEEHVYVAVFDGVVTVSMGEQSVELAAGECVQARLGQPLVPAVVSRPSSLEATTLVPAEPSAQATLTDREKTLFPPVETPTRPNDPSQLYTVKKGDTLYSIARQFGVSWEAIWKANKDQLESPELIRVGQQLRIPRP